MATAGGSFRHAARAPAAAEAAGDALSADSQDQALLRAIQAGDPNAWSMLITKYQDRLYAVCLRMVNDREAAADLTQDAFVKIIQGLGTYDGRSKLSTWLIRVAMNTCLSWQRSQKLRRHASLDAGTPGSGGFGGVGGEGSKAANGRAGPPSTRAARPSGATPIGPAAGGLAQGRELTPQESVELSEQHGRVASALASLNADQRAILVLRDVQGLEYEQIAEVLEIAVGTVKSRLFRARLALRELLEGKPAAAERGMGGQVPGGRAEGQ